MGPAKADDVNNVDMGKILSTHRQEPYARTTQWSISAPVKLAAKLVQLAAQTVTLTSRKALVFQQAV
jgi:hypothetical protein